jgi:hypothetical protein
MKISRNMKMSQDLKYAKSQAVFSYSVLYVLPMGAMRALLWLVRGGALLNKPTRFGNLARFLCRHFTRFTTRQLQSVGLDFTA